SAQLITTMDTPPLIHRLIYRQPGRNAMARATLGFCGIRPVRSLVFGSVKDASQEQRQRWLEQAHRHGKSLERSRITPGEQLRHKAGAWLKAMRLQFYPMTWLAYAAGALAASPADGVFGNPLFWLGYLCLFLLEVAPASALLLSLVPASALVAVSVLGVVMTLLAIGYTAPPLKLSYRGLGELDVSLTHSIGVILCGYVFLGGAWNDALPWLLSLPLLLAIMPSITLSGIPDLEADDAAGKRTLAVRLGQHGALIVCLIFTLLAAVAALIWHLMNLAGGAFAGIAYVVIPHAALLSWLLYKRIESRTPAGRIDGLMAASLTYVLWFGLFPLFRLAG
ncbi:MAG: UbiA family prenyltransferase, partial [Thiobacillus sp.]